jgi:hypothetical protein
MPWKSEARAIQPQSKVGGRDDFIGTRLAHVRPVFRILAFGHDVWLALLYANVFDGNTAHDGFSVGVLVLAVIRQDDDGMRLHNLGAAQDQFVGWITFDDVDVVEGDFILFYQAARLRRVCRERSRLAACR